MSCLLLDMAFTAYGILQQQQQQHLWFPCGNGCLQAAQQAAQQSHLLKPALACAMPRPEA